MDVGNPDFCPEDYLFRKLAENFDYIKNKNVKVQVALCNSWSTELRKNNYNYTVHWVRKWVADIMRMLKQGIIPGFAQTEELVHMAQEMVMKSDNLYRNTSGNVQVLTTPYSEAEQETIVARIAERAGELSERTKGSKIKFVRDMVEELAKKGFNRSPRSVGHWVTNVLKGKFPQILKQSRMSIIRDILTQTFGFDKDTRQNERSSIDFDEIIATHGFTDELVWKQQKPEQREQSVPSCAEEFSESYTNTSTDDGSHHIVKTTEGDTAPMNLRTLLEISEQSVEVINCNPFVNDLACPPLENMDRIAMDDSDVLKRYQEKKIALQTARKRKRVAEREVDEIREQLRIADTKVAVEAKKVHFLEEELEELKEYLEDSNV